MTILLVGGNGLVGTKLVKALIEKGHKVIAYVERIPECQEESCIYVQGDLSEYGTINKIFHDYQIDRVIHNAAISHPKLFANNPYKIYHVNVLGTLHVLEAARNHDVKRFIYISSGAVYGNQIVDLVREEMPLGGVNPYGASKVAAEEIVRNYGMDTMALRLGCVYGPGRFLECPIKKLLTDAVKYKAIDWKCGRDQTYDYIYIKDCINAIVSAVLAPSHTYFAYNIGGGEDIQFKQIIAALQRMEPDMSISIGSGTLGFDSHGPFSIERMKSDFGWSPKYTIEMGVEAYYNYLKTHEY